MAIQIGAKPDSGFDDPIGMLKDCHRRIERFLHVLCVVAERARNRRLTEKEKAAVEAALNYFRVSGQRHTADEEVSLFPRLRAEGTTGQLEQLDRLEQEHHHANALHAAVDHLYTTWISAGMLRPEQEAQLLPATEELKHLYAEHIRAEENIVFPQAAQVLDRQTIAAIGAEFSARRK
ncbi:MAG: hemerythrin domain-containing protein [Acidobacteriaceae bacterium]